MWIQEISVAPNEHMIVHFSIKMGMTIIIHGQAFSYATESYQQLRGDSLLDRKLYRVLTRRPGQLKPLIQLQSCTVAALAKIYLVDTPLFLLHTQFHFPLFLLWGLFDWSPWLSSSLPVWQHWQKYYMLTLHGFFLIHNFNFHFFCSEFMSHKNTQTYVVSYISVSSMFALHYACPGSDSQWGDFLNQYVYKGFSFFNSLHLFIFFLYSKLRIKAMCLLSQCEMLKIQFPFKASARCAQHFKKLHNVRKTR